MGPTMPARARAPRSATPKGSTVNVYEFTSNRTGDTIRVSAPDMDTAYRALPAEFDRSYGVSAYRITPAPVAAPVARYVIDPVRPWRGIAASFTPAELVALTGNPAPATVDLFGATMYRED